MSRHQSFLLKIKITILSLPLFSSLSLWPVKRACAPCSEVRERERDKQIKREREQEREKGEKRVACTRISLSLSISLTGDTGNIPWVTAHLHSKRSSFSQSVNMRDYYINYGISPKTTSCFYHHPYDYFQQ